MNKSIVYWNISHGNKREPALSPSCGCRTNSGGGRKWLTRLKTLRKILSRWHWHFYTRGSSRGGKQLLDETAGPYSCVRRNTHQDWTRELSWALMYLERLAQSFICWFWWVAVPVRNTNASDVRMHDRGFHTWLCVRLYSSFPYSMIPRRLPKRWSK